MKRFIACQTGARHNYALPSILAKADMLEVFYTDLCGNEGVGATISQWCPNFLKRGAINNLINRRLPANIVNKTHTFPWEVLRYLIHQQLVGTDPKHSFKAHQKFHHQWGNAMVNRGFGDATHCFIMFTEGLPLLKAAKKRGLTTVSEIIILWSANAIVEIEQEQFPELETPMSLVFFGQQTTELAKIMMRDFFANVDWTIAPSEAVRQDQAINYGFPAERCFVVPYAVGDDWFTVPNYPTKGRVLFVGTAELRKGIHYLAMAANKLNHRNYEYRVAGNASDTIRNHSLMQKLNFLGRVPKACIAQEYEQTDILVLPTLAEGSAGVTYEALAMGIPIITTEAAGSVIRNGIDGFIVPERDANTLAERIEELVEDRELRDRMSLAAKQRAKEYTWDKYAERILEVFAKI